MQIESRDEQQRLKRLLIERLMNRFSSGGYLGGEFVPDDEEAIAAIRFSLNELEKASSGE